MLVKVNSCLKHSIASQCAYHYIYSFARKFKLFNRRYHILLTFSCSKADITLAGFSLHDLMSEIMWLDKRIYVVFDDLQKQWRALLYILTVDRANVISNGKQY